MRKIGMITDIEEDIITLTIWDSTNNKIKEIKLTEFDKNLKLMIGYYFEYQEDTNQIIPLTNINYTKEEQNEIFEILKTTITNHPVYSAFCDQLDAMLEGRDTKNNHR